jgi:hypothetical protein
LTQSEKLLKNLKKNLSKIIKKIHQKLIKRFIKKSPKKLVKIIEKSPKNPYRSGKKIFFPIKLKISANLFSIKIKKKIFFLGLGEKKFIKNQKSQDWSP